MKKQPKKKFLCVDGPFKGHKLALHPDGNTLIFQVRQQRGRYVYNPLNGAKILYWEAHR